MILSHLPVAAQVICSPGVAAAAGTRHGEGCLLAAPVVDAQQQYAGVEWACLVTKHVCLDLMVPTDEQVVSHLGRYRLDQAAVLTAVSASHPFVELLLASAAHVYLHKLQHCLMQVVLASVASIPACVSYVRLADMGLQHNCRQKGLAV